MDGPSATTDDLLSRSLGLACPNLMRGQQLAVSPRKEEEGGQFRPSTLVNNEGSWSRCRLREGRPEGCENMSQTLKCRPAKWRQERKALSGL